MTAENTTPATPAIDAVPAYRREDELPAGALSRHLAFLAGAGDADVTVSIVRYGPDPRAIHLVAERGGWELSIYGDGSGATLEYRRGAPELGTDWGFALDLLADLLRDPRVRAQIDQNLAACRADVLRA